MNTTTIARLGLSAALGAVCAAVFTYAPPAHADADGYLTDVIGMGFTHTDGVSGLLQLGYAICETLSIPGIDGNDVAREIYVNSGLSVSRADSIDIVIAAVENLCPEYDHRGESIA